MGIPPGSLLQRLTSFARSAEGLELLQQEPDLVLDGSGAIKRGLAFYIPSELVPEVLTLLHDSPWAGHPGVNTAKYHLQRAFWWPNLQKDLVNHVRECDVCARTKVVRAKPYGLLLPLESPNGPWEKVSMDFITDLPSSRGNTTIWVVVDLFTKLAHFVPLKKLPNAASLISLFTQNVFRLHGLPLEVISDRGPQFISKVWHESMRDWGVTVKTSSAFHPQTDGQTERVNQALVEYLRCYVSDSGKNWSDLLPTAEFAYNNHLHSAIGMSPFKATYGFHPRSIPQMQEDDQPKSLVELSEGIAAAFPSIKSRIEQTQLNYCKFANRRRRAPPDLREGDWVWLSSRNIQVPGLSKKLKPRFLGPYQIIKRWSPVSFRIKLPSAWKVHPTFHVSLLKPARRGVRVP